MNSKRRAELQRKLTLNAVPTPPVGLAERIKADIPKYLEAEPASARFTRSMNFNLRIAASIMVLATSVVVAMMVMQRNPEQKSAAIQPRVVMFPPASRAVATTDTSSTTQMARTEEVNLDIVQEAPELPRVPAARVAPPALIEQQHYHTADEPGRAQATVADADAESRAERDDTYDGVASGVVGGRVEAQPAQHQVAEAPAPPPSADYAPEPAAPAPESIAVTGEAPLMESRRERSATAKMATAPAAAMAPAPVTQAEAKKKDSVFGISVSSQAFNDIRTTLESGKRPAASSVDVEALVNYFAGAPEKRPRKVNLEVEASPAAVPAEGDHAVLRFTVDTPAGSGIAATNARIDVVVNDEVVAHAQRVGDGDPLARESVLPKGTSVTGLYELEMIPGLHSSQVVATVRLHYMLNNSSETITRIVNGKDLAGSWQRASRRHRLASLGALWGESLKSKTGGGGVDVARRAEELATQEPDDERARELARAANTSAGGGR